MNAEARRLLPRWIVFAIIGIVVTVSLKIPRLSNFKATKVVLGVYDQIEKLPEGSPILISSDFDPGAEAELEPMMNAVLAHCWRRKLRVSVMSLYSPNSMPLAERIVTAAAEKAGAVYGKDYVLLDYRPGNAAPILALGQAWSAVYTKDKKGTDLSKIDAIRGINKLGDFPYVVCLTVSTTIDSWISAGNAKYGVKVGLGCTAVMATDYYPYWASGQVTGILGGLAGAAQYESRILGDKLDQFEKPGEDESAGLASSKMPTQNWVHATIVLLIVAGNILHFMKKRQEKQA